MILSKFKIPTFLLMVACSLVLYSCHAGIPTDAAFLQSPPSHAQWDALLKKHVAANGDVDYKGFIKDKQKLNSYLKLLQAGVPNAKPGAGKNSLPTGLMLIMPLLLN